MAAPNPVTIKALSWPVADLSQGVSVLAQKARLAAGQLPVLPPLQADTIETGLAATASSLGLELEAVQVTYPEMGQLVRRAAPAILQLPGNSEPRFLLLLKHTWRGMALIDPQHHVRYVSTETVRAALCEQLEAPLTASIERVLAEAGVAPERRPRAGRAMLDQQLSATQIQGCWLLRLSPGDSLWRQMWHARLLRPVVGLFGVQVVQYLLLIAAWWILGQQVLGQQITGRPLEWGWLLAWALLLFTIVPFQAWGTWSEGRFITGAATLFKQRLLAGILRLEPEETRHQGAGQFLGRVLEIETLELLALNGGLATLTAFTGLIAAGMVLSQGAGGWVHVLLLLGWLLFIILLGRIYFKRYHVWDNSHREMTNDLVERMVGHRTRLVQESPDHWHQEEDRLLHNYLVETDHLDQIGVWLHNALPQGWLLVGILGLLPAFLFNSASVASLAVAIGGIALAFQAFTGLTAGLTSLLQAMVAWQEIAPLYQAAVVDRPAPDVTPALDREPVVDMLPLLEADGLAFRHQQRREYALDRCHVQIYSGERVLLEGPSGGGKSTLAALLAGLRTPEAGLLLWQGYDWQTMGAAGWQRQVVLSPQFHENHIITATLAFNLLMGRRWPPKPGDMQEAETICRELGLGNLLDKMPAGLLQMVGDGGWQLSHGERSRVYIARTLLQSAKLIILDENFAALDPDNLSQALTSVFKRAPTLLVIAHP